MENSIVSELGREFESKLGFRENNPLAQDVGGNSASMSMKSSPSLYADNVFNIGVNENVQPFLQGQIHGLPVNLFKNPNGPLSRSAAIETSLSQKRTQLRLSQVEEQHSIPWAVKNPLTEISGFARLKEEFIQAVHGNQVLIVCGGTGSDNTMQFIEYLSEAGCNVRGTIGCTQLLNSTPATLVNVLLREITLDVNLTRYSAIVLDVTCERTVYTDLLLGLLKQLVQRRPDFRLIITCALRDAEKFSQYFFNSNMFRIPSRNTFQVELHHTKNTETDYLEAAIITVLQLHLTEPEGDILVFFTDQEDIDHARRSLTERIAGIREIANTVELIVVPDSDVQSNFFYAASFGKRRVFLATDMVESYLRIDGIIYVIDSGFAKVNVYNLKHGLNSQVIVPISQTLARNRAACASHTRPGKCFRLYTSSVSHNEMLPESVPESQRIHLGAVILKMKAMGINNLLAFEFIDPPSPHFINYPMRELYNLGALDEDGKLTEMGRLMSGFSIEPSLSKMLSFSALIGCSEEIMTVIAMLRLGNIFYRPCGKELVADERRAHFIHPEGDHLTLLAVYNAWMANGFSFEWCLENFVQYRLLRKAFNVRQGLMGAMNMLGLEVASDGENSVNIRRAIVAGLSCNAAKREQNVGYRTLVGDRSVYIHGDSALYQRQPDWVVYSDVASIEGSDYIREVTTIEPGWLIELAPQCFRVTNQ